MRAGDLIGERFEILELAGRGGMGTVHRARDRQSADLVAVKVLRAQGGEHAERFEREARLLASVVHQGIVRYVAHGLTSEGEPYLCMEWVSGETLSERLSRGGLGVGDSVKVGLQIAASLAELHGRGIVHRDLKPSNLMLAGCSIDKVMLLDFGLARPSAPGHRALTITGAMLGTPGYMAPEQARGERDVGAPADVYALGCVLFKCLSRRAVFEGNPLSVLLKVVLEEPPPLGELVDVPPPLEELVHRMLSKLPESRPADAAEVHAALSRLNRLEDSARERPRTALTATERRVFSLVLAGATELDEQAERAVRDAAARHEGAIDLLADGSLLVKFGRASDPARATATDLAARAARCALAIRSILPGAPAAVVSGRGATSGSAALADVIEQAVAMIANHADAVRVDEITAGLLGARFDLGGDEHGLLLRAERDAAAPARTLLGKSTPCVGRDRELATLRSTLDDCAAEPRAHAVLVTGPGGIGKSRLCVESLRHAREIGAEVWMASGDPISAGSPFGMIAAALRRAAGVLEGEPDLVRRRKLRARVARHVAPADVPRVTEFLAEISGASVAGEESVQLRAARQDAMLMGNQMRRAWEDLLMAEASAQPLVLVLEDLHWGDLPSVSFVDAALRHLAEQPLMVLGIGRDEVRTMFPDLWGERALTEIKLRELSGKASERLVREVLGPGEAAATVARVVQHAAGNAFYLEELIRAVAEGKGDALPETVLAMVQARLEGQAAVARRVLRAASVFGQVFWGGGLSALLDGVVVRSELDAVLGRLVDGELIIRREEAKFGDEAEYAFRHALVREATYATLTDDDRALGHRLAGGWLEAAGERDPMALAEHFERGGEPGRAIERYVRAAEQALEGNDFAAVLARALRGIACGAAGETLARLRLLEAEAHGWRAEYELAKRRGVEAMELSVRGTPVWYESASHVAEACGKLHDGAGLAAVAAELEDVADHEATLPLGHDLAGSHRQIACARTALQLLHAGEAKPARSLLERLGALAEDALEPAALAWAARVRALEVLVEGDPATYLTLCEVGVESSERAGDVRQACVTRTNLGFAALELGCYAQAEATLRDALAAAERIGLPPVAGVARHILGLTLAQRGAFDEAKAVEQRALEAFAALGDSRMEGACRVYLARIRELGGELAEAGREARAGLAVGGGFPPVRACGLVALARVLIAERKPAEALEAAGGAFRILEELGGIEEGESLIRLSYAQALELAGDAGAARGAIEGARARLLARAERMKDARLRASFLAEVPENALTLRLAAAAAR